MSDSTLTEVGTLAREMANAFGRMVKHYQEYCRMDHDSAVQEANTFLKTSPTLQEWAASWPTDQVSWIALDHLGGEGAEIALQLWERIKCEARADLDNGHEVARKTEAVGTPWQRAMFLAVRASMIEDWKPTGGVELRLIDMMAQAFTMWQYWLERLADRTHFQADYEEPNAEGHYDLPRVIDVQANDEAAMMADRFNRVFLRTLRALRDLRRYPLRIGSVGQLNMAQQQVNTAQLTDSNELR